MPIIVALGLAAAFVYGASDFLGGYAARYQSSLTVTFIAFMAGTLTSGLCLPAVASSWSVAALRYGAIAGLTAAGSIWLLYTALAIGPVSILAPMVAVIAALLPVLYGLLHQERLGVLGDAAIAAVLLSALLMAYDPGSRSARVGLRALLTGLAAGVVTGAYILSLGLTPVASGAVPIVAEFAVGAALLGTTAAISTATRRRGRRLRPDSPVPRFTRHAASGIALGSGATQAIADVLVIVGIHRGQLAVMAALMSLYPLGTMGCALIVTRERIAPVQAFGVVLAVAASAVLGVVVQTR